MAAPPQRKPISASVAEEQAKCFELRKQGHSIRAIAEMVKLPKSTVQDRIDAAIAELVTPLAEDVRQMELERLDAWLLKLNEQIKQGYQVARSIEVAIRVSERRAKLLGIDAPEKIEATVTEITQEDIALAELVNEAKAAADATEAALRGTNG